MVKAINCILVLFVLTAIPLTLAEVGNDEMSPGAPPGAVLTQKYSFEASVSVHQKASTLGGYAYVSTLYTNYDIILIGWIDGTKIIVQNAETNAIIWECTLDKGNHELISPGEGVYKVGSDEKISIIAGSPESCTVVGYYARNKDGLAAGTEFYTYIPPTAYSGGEHLDVFAYQDGTTVTIENAQTGAVLLTKALNKGKWATLTGNLGELLFISSDKKVSVLTYFDEGYYVPTESGLFTGNEFFTFVGDITNGVNDINIVAYQDGTSASIKNAETGATIWSGSLDKGKIHSETLTNVYVHVESNKPVSVAVIPFKHFTAGYHEHHFVPDMNGGGVGTEFYVPSRDGGQLWIFSYHDNNHIEVYKETGELYWEGDLDVGGWYDVAPEYGIYHVISDEPTSILSGYGYCGASFVPLATTEAPYDNIIGHVYDSITFSPISGAEIDLCEANTFFIGPAYIPIDTTTTDTNGGFSFKDVNPGSYVVSASATGYIPGASVPFEIYVGKVQTLDIPLSEGNFLIQLEPQMKNLNSQCVDVMDYEATLMGEITTRAPDDIGEDAGIWTAIDITGDVMSGGVMSLTSAVIENKVKREAYEKALRLAIAGTIKHMMEKPKFAIDVLKTAALDGINYILDMSPKGKDEIKNTELYQKVVDILQQDHDEFIDYAKVTIVDDDFDFDSARNAIESTTSNVELAKKGEMMLIITPDTTMPPRDLTMKNAYSSYMQTATITGLLSWTNKALSVVQIGSGTIAIGSAATGVGAPPGAAAAAICVGTGKVKDVTECAELAAKAGVAVTFVGAGNAFTKDLLMTTNIYSDTADFLEDEATTPYYLNANNQFDADVTIDPHFDWTIYDKNIVFKIPFFPLAKKDMTVSVENTGNVDSKIRVVAQGFWDYDIPGYLEWIFGDVDKIPMQVCGQYAMEDVDQGQGFTTDLGYIGYYMGLTNVLNPHFVRIDTYSGVQLVDHEEFFYYVALGIPNPFSASESEKLTESEIKDVTFSGSECKLSTLSGPLTMEQYIAALPNTTKVLETELAPSDTSKQVSYTTKVDTNNIEFIMFAPSGPEIDLHVYDENGYHVGYNVISGNDDVQIPSASYTGRSSNPEYILIPNADGKEYTIKVDLAKPISSNPSQVNVFAVETPTRPSILAVSPGEIHTLISSGQNMSLNIVIGEAGGQKDIQDVQIITTEFSNGIHNLPPLSPNSISLGTIAAKDQKGVTFNLTIPESAVFGKYTGSITVESSNAGSVTIPVDISVMLMYNITSPYEGKNLTYSSILPLNITFMNSGEEITANANITIEDERGNVTYQGTHPIDIGIGTTEKIIEIDTFDINLFDETKTQILSVTTAVNSEDGEILALDILSFRLTQILETDIPNVKLLYADPTVTSINVTSLSLSEIDETYKPEECITPQSAYMIDSTGSGNFTLRFTDISGADSILVYKIDPSSTPPDQWILLDATTTADTVTFTMEVGDPPVVFCSCAPPTAASTTPTGAPKDTYRVYENVYAAGSGFTPGTNVDIYVVPDQDWNDGDQIPSDVTGAVETVSAANGDVGPMLVWHAPLTPGSYDIVIDANQNDVYDAAADGLDSGSPGFVVVASPPPTPPTDVPALTPHGIIALVGLLCVIGMSRIRRRFN